MADKESIIKELDYLTDLLSDRSRTLATGVLAFCWLFMLQNQTGGENANVFDTSSLLAPVILSVFSLLIDASQYWIGYLQVTGKLLTAESSGSEDVKFDPESTYYKLRVYAFYLKQLFVLAAIVWLLVLVVLIVLR